MRSLVAVSLLIFSCGQLGEVTDNSYECMMNGERCHEAGVDSRVGPEGSQGIQGTVGPAGPSGEMGERGLPGQNGETIQGPAGAQGIAGERGEAGSAGVGCSAEQIENGAVITCGEDVVVILDGEDAPTTYSVVAIHDPCGPQGSFDEVILELGNGTFLAHYSHGSKQFLVVISNGSYVTTDGTSCHFSVDNTGIQW